MNYISKEIDVEMSDNFSGDSEDYNVERSPYNDSVTYSECSSKSSSIDDNSGNSYNPNVINHSYYNISEIKKNQLDLKNDYDYFDPDEMHRFFKNIKKTGDHEDSDDSSKTCVDKNVSYKNHKTNKFKKEVNKMKAECRHLKFIEKTIITSNSNKTDNPDLLTSKNPFSSKNIVSNLRKSNSKISNIKETSDMDSITLFIKVPRNKLLSHLKDKSKLDQRKSTSPKSISSYNLGDSTSTNEDSNSEKLNNLSNVSSPVSKTAVNSISDITSYIDKSKEIIQKYKQLRMFNKKLQTSNIYQSFVIDKIEKETQTIIQSDSPQITTGNNDENYFLCNICHKIVPSNLSPICLKLTCSAVNKCDHLFHCELDLIMHLPVKHASEFESYQICLKCNLMFHPSNTVSIKGSCTCLDCLDTLVELANE